MKLSEHIKSQLKAFKKPYYFEEDSLVDRQKIIKKINHYKRDLYLICSDVNAIFLNIASPRVPHFKKNIIISIKDLYPEGRGDYNIFQSWITKIRFRKWARDDDFSGDLNNIATELTEYGECVAKVSTNSKQSTKDVSIPNLQKIHFDRTVDFSSSDKIEIHELTEAQLRKKDGTWDNIEDIITNAETLNTKGQGTTKYILYEFWGYYKEDIGKAGKFVHKIVAGSGEKEVTAFDFKQDKEDKPMYYYFKLNKELIGLYQRLFILQKLMNKRVNQNDEAQAVASLLLLKTKDSETHGNVLKDAVSGQILNTADLEQLGIDNRALTGYINEMAMIEAQADRLCMTPEVITGSDMPSGTPFRSTAAMINKAVKAFKSIRTEIAGNVIKMLEKEIFPAVVKKWDDQFVDIADCDSDIIEYDRRVSHFLLVDWIRQVKEQTKRFPSMQDIEDKRQEIIDQFDDKGRRIYISKKFFNWDYGFIYNATNEVEDREQQNDVMNNLMQYKMMNPAIANDPLFKQMAEKNGVSAYKISQKQITELQQGAIKVPTAPVGKKEDKLMSQIDSA